jgi:EAL domain-containing protein (putative c-di-GMP-specific phosphodiesterase class I)
MRQGHTSLWRTDLGAWNLRITRGTEPLFILASVMCVLAIGIALVATLMGSSDRLVIAAIFAAGLAQLAILALARRDNRDVVIRKLLADLAALDRRVAILTEVRVPVKMKPEPEEKVLLPQLGPAQAIDQPQIAQEQLDFYLEPVVDLSSGRTAHYRASVMLRMADGVSFGMDSVQAGADRAGVRPLLETLTLARALPALRRLKERGRGAMIFTPASAGSFASEDFLARVEDILEAGEGIADAVVLDMSEVALAELSAEGMQGVTRLADKGIHFCLSGASSYGPDPATLASIGFRFVMVEAHLLARSDYDEFAQACGYAGIEIIAAHVDTRDVLAQLRGHTSLGFGELFAPPRLVRELRDSQDAAAA